MNPQQQFRRNSDCHASGGSGRGSIVSHSLKPRRYKCKCCKKTFSATKGTAVYGIKKPAELFVTVITLFGTLWLALAMMVPTRLWLGGVVSAQRDLALIQSLVSQVCHVEAKI